MKVGNTDSVSKKMQERHNVFDVERLMYHSVIPEWEQMYLDAGCKVKFGAEHLCISTKENCIFFEDLRPLGFKNVNRLEGLDVEHTKAALEKLAQWHAVSAVRLETKGLYREMLSLGVFKEKNKICMKELNENLSVVFLDYFKEYKGSADYYVDVERFQKNFMDSLFSVAQNDQNDDEFRVLNHGDCWSNNVMFQHDSAGNIKETRLIDYQIPRCSSPAHDLLFLLISSTKYELKLTCFEYFIKYYHHNLRKHLMFLKYPKKIPPLKDIHIACLKHGVWGYYVSTVIMPTILLESNGKSSPENFLSNSTEGLEFKKLLYSNTRYKRHMEIILPWLHNRGVFEC